MVVGFMNGSKKARNIPSIANKTTIFGDMGGMAAQTGAPVTMHSNLQHRANTHLEIPLEPKAGLQYMRGDNPMGRYMLSKNPVGSGGVGRTQFTFARCSGTCPIPVSEQEPVPEPAPEPLLGSSDPNYDYLRFETAPANPVVFSASPDFFNLQLWMNELSIDAPTLCGSSVDPNYDYLRFETAPANPVVFSASPDFFNLQLWMNELSMDAPTLCGSGPEPGPPEPSWPPTEEGLWVGSFPHFVTKNADGTYNGTTTPINVVNILDFPTLQQPCFTNDDLYWGVDSSWSPTGVYPQAGQKLNIDYSIDRLQEGVPQGIFGNDGWYDNSRCIGCSLANPSDCSPDTSWCQSNDNPFLPPYGGCCCPPSDGHPSGTGGGNYDWNMGTDDYGISGDGPHYPIQHYALYNNTSSYYYMVQIPHLWGCDDCSQAPASCLPGCESCTNSTSFPNGIPAGIDCMPWSAPGWDGPPTNFVGSNGGCWSSDPTYDNNTEVYEDNWVGADGVMYNINGQRLNYWWQCGPYVGGDDNTDSQYFRSGSDNLSWIKISPGENLGSGGNLPAMMHHALDCVCERTDSYGGASLVPNPCTWVPTTYWGVIEGGEKPPEPAEPEPEPEPPNPPWTSSHIGKLNCWQYSSDLDEQIELGTAVFWGYPCICNICSNEPTCSPSCITFNHTFMVDCSGWLFSKFDNNATKYGEVEYNLSQYAIQSSGSQLWFSNFWSGYIYFWEEDSPQKVNFHIEGDDCVVCYILDNSFGNWNSFSDVNSNPGKETIASNLLDTSKEWYSPKNNFNWSSTNEEDISFSGADTSPYFISDFSYTFQPNKTYSIILYYWMSAFDLSSQSYYPDPNAYYTFQLGIDGETLTSDISNITWIGQTLPDPSLI